MAVIKRVGQRFSCLALCAGIGVLGLPAAGVADDAYFSLCLTVQEATPGTPAEGDPVSLSLCDFEGEPSQSWVYETSYHLGDNGPSMNGGGRVLHGGTQFCVQATTQAGSDDGAFTDTASVTLELTSKCGGQGDYPAGLLLYDPRPCDQGDKLYFSPNSPDSVDDPELFCLGLGASADSGADGSVGIGLVPDCTMGSVAPSYGQYTHSNKDVSEVVTLQGLQSAAGMLELKGVCGPLCLNALGAQYTPEVGDSVTCPYLADPDSDPIAIGLSPCIGEAGAAEGEDATDASAKFSQDFYESRDGTYLTFGAPESGCCLSKIQTDASFPHAVSLQDCKSNPPPASKKWNYVAEHRTLAVTPDPDTAPNTSYCLCGTGTESFDMARGQQLEAVLCSECKNEFSRVVEPGQASSESPALRFEYAPPSIVLSGVSSLNTGGHWSFALPAPMHAGKPLTAVAVESRATGLDFDTGNSNLIVRRDAICPEASSCSSVVGSSSPGGATLLVKEGESPFIGERAEIWQGDIALSMPKEADENVYLVAKDVQFYACIPPKPGEDCYTNFGGSMADTDSEDQTNKAFPQRILSPLNGLYSHEILRTSGSADSEITREPVADHHVLFDLTRQKSKLLMNPVPSEMENMVWLTAFGTGTLGTPPFNDSELTSLRLKHLSAKSALNTHKPIEIDYLMYSEEAPPLWGVVDTGGKHNFMTFADHPLERAGYDEGVNVFPIPFSQGTPPATEYCRALRHKNAGMSWTVAWTLSDKDRSSSKSYTFEFSTFDAEPLPNRSDLTNLLGCPSDFPGNTGCPETGTGNPAYGCVNLGAPLFFTSYVAFDYDTGEIGLAAAPEPTTVPEPTSVLLQAAALLTLAGLRRRCNTPRQ